MSLHYVHLAVKDELESQTQVANKRPFFHMTRKIAKRGVS
jgi:hypothetical protein